MSRSNFALYLSVRYQNYLFTKLKGVKIQNYPKLSIYKTERGKNLQEQKPRINSRIFAEQREDKTLIVEFRRATRRETNTLDEI